MACQFFDEEAYLELEKKLLSDNGQDAQDDLEALNDAVASLFDYVDTVVRNEIRLRLNKRSLEGQEYRDTINDYDRNRHSKHESAIINTKLINRLAEIYGIRAVFTGDVKERHQVASFCMEFSEFIFRNRMKKLS